MKKKGVQNKPVQKGDASKARKHILWFREIGIKDIALVGGKNASLGEMYKK